MYVLCKSRRSGWTLEKAPLLRQQCNPEQSLRGLCPWRGFKTLLDKVPCVGGWTGAPTLPQQHFPKARRVHHGARQPSVERNCSPLCHLVRSRFRGPPRQGEHRTDPHYGDLMVHRTVWAPSLRLFPARAPGSCPSLSSSHQHPALTDTTARLWIGPHQEEDKRTISSKNSPAKKIVELHSEMPLVFHSRQKGTGAEGRQKPGEITGGAGPQPSPATRGAGQALGDTQDERLPYVKFALLLPGFSLSTPGGSHAGESLPTV